MQTNCDTVVKGDIDGSDIDTDHIVHIMKIWHQRRPLDQKVEDLLTLHQRQQTLQGCQARRPH